MKSQNIEGNRKLDHFLIERAPKMKGMVLEFFSFLCFLWGIKAWLIWQENLADDSYFQCVKHTGFSWLWVLSVWLNDFEFDCAYLLSNDVFQFLLLGAVPFPKDVPRLKRLGVGGVITLNEPYETLVPTSLYLVRLLLWCGYFDFWFEEHD